MLELRALSVAFPIPRIEWQVALQLIRIRSLSNECNQLRLQGNKGDFSMKAQLVTARAELNKPLGMSKLWRQRWRVLEVWLNPASSQSASTLNGSTITRAPLVQIKTKHQSRLRINWVKHLIMHEHKQDSILRPPARRPWCRTLLRWASQHQETHRKSAPLRIITPINQKLSKAILLRVLI